MYAVVFSYSFDLDTAVYLFESIEDAKNFLKSNFDEECRIDIEENEYDTDVEISDDGMYAKITNHFEDEDDITEYHIGTVYSTI